MARPKVFISYARADRAFVSYLASYLKSEGAELFLDVAHLQGGLAWSERIQRQLNLSDFVLVVLSQYSIDSKYVRLEYETALRNQKRIIPIMVGSIDVPLSLSSFVYIDARENVYSALYDISKALGLPSHVPDQPKMPYEDLELSGQITSSPEDDIKFTAFYSNQPKVEHWFSLLIYAHILSATETIRNDARKFLAEIGENIYEAHGTNFKQVNVRNINFTITPHFSGITFSPKSITFKWIEDWHRFIFRMKADSQLTDSAVNAIVNIFAGPLLIATIKLPMIILSQNTPKIEEEKKKDESPVIPKKEVEAIFPKVFPSYSRKDKAIVYICRKIYRALRLNYLLDIDTILCGDILDEKLKSLIEEADVFQIFWSKNAAKSQFVHDEWLYAVKQHKKRIKEVKETENLRELYICGVYWDEPMYSQPPQLKEYVFDYLHIPRIWRWYSIMFT